MQQVRANKGEDGQHSADHLPGRLHGRDGEYSDHRFLGLWAGSRAQALHSHVHVDGVRLGIRGRHLRHQSLESRENEQLNPLDGAWAGLVHNVAQT